MNLRKESMLLLEELSYNSRNIRIMFERERSSLNKLYGNKWLLCAVVDGRLKIFDVNENRNELEIKGFELPVNILFDVLNPTIQSKLKNKPIYYSNF